jgi:hypothetical protein
MRIAYSVLKSAATSEPDLPPEINSWMWHETWHIRPEGFQECHTDIRDPFDEWSMLRGTRTGIFFKILFNPSYKVVHLTRRHIDRSRHCIISLASHEELDPLAGMLKASHRQVMASLAHKLDTNAFVCIKSKCQAFVAQFNCSAAHQCEALAEIMPVRSSASARKVQA